MEIQYGNFIAITITCIVPLFQLTICSLACVVVTFAAGNNALLSHTEDTRIVHSCWLLTRTSVFCCKLQLWTI